MRKPLIIYILTSVLVLFCYSEAYAQQGEVIINQPRDINVLLELKKSVNANETYFKIQIYNGTRSGAENARARFRKYFYGYSTSLEYDTPNYKIWIGNFKTRLEADKAYLKIKTKFNNAFVFKPKKEKS